MPRFFALFTVAAVGCASPWATIPPLPDADYAVYRAVLAARLPAAGSLPVLETLGPFPEPRSPDPLPAEFIEPFQAIQKAELRRLTPTLLGQLPVRVVTYSEFKKLRHRPDSVLTLSRVGFSSDSTRAVLYLSAACRLCGTGALALLTRDTTGLWRQTSQVTWNAEPLP